MIVFATRVSAIVKDGVVFTVLKPTTRAIIDAAEYVFGRHGLTPTITSAEDGTHMTGSRHYTGDALDFRRHESDARGLTDIIAEELTYYLGDAYDVVVEPTHLHVEYDPT